MNLPGSSKPSKENYANELCKFYPHCFRGDSCRFIHPVEGEHDENSTQGIGHCLICLETKIKVYGLLSCNHVHCFDCITEWRSSAKSTSSKESLQRARSCTVCAQESLFVVPSNVFFIGRDKIEYIKGYIDSKKNIPCKRFNYGNGYCPFKHSCFYSHVNQFGKDEKIKQREAWIKTTNGKDITPGSVESILLSRNRQRPTRNRRIDFFDQFTSNELEMMMNAINMIRIDGMRSNDLRFSSDSFVGYGSDYVASDEDSLDSEFYQYDSELDFVE